jgi:CheY-like chemotaxis protein
MDLSLPIVDGWEAIRRIKGDPKTSHVPIIALTGHVLQAHSNSARDAGCDAVVTKPCLPEALLREIERLLAPK